MSNNDIIAMNTFFSYFGNANMTGFCDEGRFRKNSGYGFLFDCLLRFSIANTFRNRLVCFYVNHGAVRQARANYRTREVAKLTPSSLLSVGLRVDVIILSNP